jgi:hypothetical protein
MPDEKIEVNYVRWRLGNSYKCKELLASFLTALSLIYAFYLIAVSPPPAQFRSLHRNEYGGRRSGSFQATGTALGTTAIGWIPEWRQRSFLGSACVVKRRRRSLLYLRHIKAPIGRRAARQLIHRKPDRSLDAGSGLRLIVRVETVPGADQRVERIAHAHRIGPRRQITRDLDIYQRVIFAMQDEERNLARFKVTDAEKLAPPSVVEARFRPGNAELVEPIGNLGGDDRARRRTPIAHAIHVETKFVRVCVHPAQGGDARQSSVCRLALGCFQEMRAAINSTSSRPSLPIDW